MKISGYMLLQAKIVATIFTSLSYFLRVKVLEIGNMELIRDSANVLKWSPFVGILLIAIVVLFI